jgi:parallel beta-helix repeat protein
MNINRKKFINRISFILLAISIIIKGLFSTPLIIDETRAEGPTEISGIISTDTIWTIENSPYIIIENTLVGEKINLTIEPGVVIKFDPGKYLRIDGTLFAQGTESEMITFTANVESPDNYIWDKIEIEEISKDSVIKYCRIEYASYGIECSASMALITDNIFFHNSIGILMYNCDSTIKNNKFINNYVGIRKGKNVIDNVFIRNSEGITRCEYVYNNIVVDNRRGIINSNFIENNYILNNEKGIDCGEGEIQIQIYNNYIVNNSEYGISIWDVEDDYDNENITSNIIANNEIGIKIGHGATSQIINNNITENKIGIDVFKDIAYSDETIFEIKNNNVQDNVEYNIQNDVDIKVIVPNNWWGTTDTSLIDTLIYDYQDDFELGKVEYLPILESPVDVKLQDMLPLSELNLEQYDFDESQEESDKDFIDFMGLEFIIAVSVIVIVLALCIFFYKRKRRDV